MSPLGRNQRGGPYGTPVGAIVVVHAVVLRGKLGWNKRRGATGVCYVY